MNLADWVANNIYTDDLVINALVIGFLFVVFYDFYHTLTSAIFSIFKKN